MDEGQLSWSEAYVAEARALTQKHFGGYLGRAFPTMRTNYRMKKPPTSVEHRIVLKNNNEYHGLEAHAWQYHVSNMYELAYEYFLMAAYCRADNDAYVAEASGIADAGHVAAVEYCLRNALFNKALSRCGRRRPWPNGASLSDLGW